MHLERARSASRPTSCTLVHIRLMLSFPLQLVFLGSVQPVLFIALECHNIPFPPFASPDGTTRLVLPCFVRCSKSPWGAHFISILIHGKQGLLPRRTFSIQECPCMPCTGSEVSLCWMVRICRGLPSGIISSLPIAFFAQNGRIDLSLDVACRCRCPTHTPGPTVRV